jgi:transcriptional regulator with XRE-family HTH domain
MNALQLKMARVALGLGVKEAAALTGVSHDTITRLEGGQTLKPATVDKVRAALETAGVIFVEENGDGPGVRLRKIPPRESIPSEDLNASNDE